MHVTGPLPLQQDAAAHEDPFLRWHVGPETPALLWRVDDAVAVTLQRERGMGAIGLGRGEHLDAVLGAALTHLRGEGIEEVRLSVPADAEVTLPAEVDEPSRWEWMWTSVASPVPVGVAWLTAAEEPAVEELLTHSPRAHARPGDELVRAWAGVRRDGRLVATGALCSTSSGTPHLRAIVTHPDHRGQGLGGAVTAALTHRGLEESPVVTLGMYSDNEGARRIYHRLGYTTSHRWVSSVARLAPSR